MGKIRELSKSTSNLVSSSQIITSVCCVVKELLENAFDSNSKTIEIKLVDFGLVKIEVKDSGDGIEQCDIENVARPHYTSKITSFLDLSHVESYGFRGEALNAICNVADLVITTNCSKNSVGLIATFDHNGNVTSFKPHSCPQGTIVSVSNIFKNIPVRKQYYKNEKNKKEELKKVEELLMSYGCIHNDVRLVLYHNQSIVWQKVPVNTTKDSLVQVFGSGFTKCLEYVDFVDEQNQRRIEMFLPKSSACDSSSSNKCVFAINKRPVYLKEFSKVLKKYYNAYIFNSGRLRYPVCYISLTLPTSEVDVNVEPNKTSVMLHHSEDILQQFSSLLEKFFTHPTCVKENSPIEGNDAILKNKLCSSDNTSKDSFQQNSSQTLLKNIKLAQNQGNFILLNNNITPDNIDRNRTKGLTRSDVKIIKDSNEPCRKKAKTNSLKDIENHVSTLKSYFSNSSPTEIEPNCMSSVTVTRNNSIEPKNNLVSHALNSSNSGGQHKSVNMSGDNDNHKETYNVSSATVNGTENDGKVPPIDLDLNLWSRGTVPLGGAFQPVAILRPKSTPVESANAAKSNETSSKSCLDADVSTTQKKLTAFDMYCCNHRLEVAAQNPNLPTSDVACILFNQWKQLSSDEQLKYKNMIPKEYPKKIKMKDKPSKCVSENLNQIKEKPTITKLRSKKQKHKIEEKTLLFDILNLKEKMMKQTKILHSSGSLDMLCCLAPGIWICKQEKSLKILNTFRLRETIIYHRLLETFYFETKHLDTSLKFHSKDLDENSLDILYQLSNGSSNSNLSDERLLANGFDIKIYKDENKVEGVEILAITTSIAFYSIDDLKEILALIKNSNFSKKLSDCRPQKAVLYLQGEANRISRQSLPITRLVDVEDLLRQKHKFLQSSEFCIHHKPFFEELYVI